MKLICAWALVNSWVCGKYGTHIQGKLFFFFWLPPAASIFWNNYAAWPSLEGDFV